MSEVLRLRKFDIATTYDFPTVMLVGKRNTGKSTLMADWLYHKRNKFPAGIIMSSTEEATGFFKKQCGIPDQFIYNDFDAGVIQKVIDRQKKRYNAGKPRPCFVVLDDMAYDKTIWKEKCIRDLFMNGRNYGIFLLFTVQSLELPVYARENVDYVCVLRQPANFAREKMYKTMFSMFPNYKYFCQVLDNTTENYECLVFDNTKQSNKLTDCFFWYKADMRPDHTWKMGAKEFHNFSRDDRNNHKRPLKPQPSKGPHVVKIS